MDKNHFVLVKRYLITLKDKTVIELDLKPEREYYFTEQEVPYIMRALRKQNVDMDAVDFITPIFIPVETRDEVKIVVGV